MPVLGWVGVKQVVWCISWLYPFTVGVDTYRVSVHIGHLMHAL